ncbi:MAG: UDP-N-acetylglucosamine 2-epimerase (non-hydrolyzing) [Pseudomonadota bacterium]
MKILNVVGARPNFMKMAPLVRCLRDRGIEQKLVHTGQHYDANLSKVFFDDLEMPEPDVFLGVGAGSPTAQIARIMLAFEEVCAAERPDLVVVVGDVNSTLACSLVGAKALIPVAHVEAGLRSFDMRMPEEGNRVVVDRLSELLFTHSQDANENLLREGIAREKLHLVGNIMIDSLANHLERTDASPILDELCLEPGRYGVVTLHRPSNVDVPETLLGIMAALHDIAEEVPLVFSCHPRTAKQLKGLAGYQALAGRGDLRLLPPLGYLDFLRLYSNSRLVLTDSGGLQEETTYLGIDCVTLRENTERPITIDEGTNRLAGTKPAQIVAAARACSGLRDGSYTPPALWDGKTAQRIVDVLERWAVQR